MTSSASQCNGLLQIYLMYAEFASLPIKKSFVFHLTYTFDHHHLIKRDGKNPVSEVINLLFQAVNQEDRIITPLHAASTSHIAMH